MKSFNIFVAVSLIAILTGFVFFKDGLNQTEPRLDTPNYLDYSNSALINAQKQGETVLFFAATTWCQTCSALEKEIKDRQAEIPSNTTILKVDYDHDTVMNRKWGVTSQHTLIALDQNGREVKRWLGGGFDTLLQQLE